MGQIVAIPLYFSVSEHFYGIEFCDMFVLYSLIYLFDF